MRAIGMRRVVLFYGVMAALAFAAIWGRGDWNHVLPPWQGQVWALHTSVGLCLGLALVGISRLMASKFEWAAQLTREFRGLVGDLSHQEIAAAALVSGIGEEALFRGVLQPALGLWIGAAVFGLLHIGPNRRFIPWTIMAFAAGLLFGLVFEWTGDLLAPTLAHIAVNYLNLRYLSPGELRTEVLLGSVGGQRAADY